MFNELEKIHARPKPFEFYTASDLWTDDHTSEQMLSYHLNEHVDLSSRNSKFIDRSVEWIVSHFNVQRGTAVADFGCGPGLYATRLAKAGADVTGIDFSARSLEYAGRVASDEGLSIKYINQDYLEFDAQDQFDLIIMIMCDFCVLSPTQRAELLGRFHAALKTGGSVLLDVQSLKAFGQREETASCEVNQLNGFWSPNRYYGFLNTFKYPEEKVVLDKFTIVESGRTRTVYNWFQHFSPESLEREFTESGFSTAGLYSDVAGTPFDPESTEFAIVAKRE